MANYFFSLPGNLTAQFKTACKIEGAERLKLAACIPGIKALDKKPDIIDLTLVHRMSSVPGLVDQGQYIKLTTPHHTELPEDTYHLFYAALRRELLKQDLYCMHAACVGRKDRFHLIAGHSGAGKTTVSQSLIDHHGMSLFSGNKTVIKISQNGSIHAVAGTKTMTALDADLTRYAYELPANDLSDREYVDIVSIHLLRLNDGVEETQYLSKLSALHTLYPFLMDSVNADVIVNAAHIFDGSPSIEIKNRLTANLSKALGDLDVQKSAGSLEFLKSRVLEP
jgi:hypothetical protein